MVGFGREWSQKIALFILYNLTSKPHSYDFLPIFYEFFKLRQNSIIFISEPNRAISGPLEGHYSTHDLGKDSPLNTLIISPKNPSHNLGKQAIDPHTLNGIPELDWELHQDGLDFTLQYFFLDTSIKYGVVHPREGP